METPREQSFERPLEAEACDQERGTWRELLRLRYPEWTRHLPWGFQHGDGWRSVTENLFRDLAGMLGADASKLEVRQVKHKRGEYRCDVDCDRLSEAQARAVRERITVA